MVSVVWFYFYYTEISENDNRRDEKVIPFLKK